MPPALISWQENFFLPLNYVFNKKAFVYLWFPDQAACIPTKLRNILKMLFCGFLNYTFRKFFLNQKAQASNFTFAAQQ